MFGDEIDQRFDFALAVVEMMRRIGETRATVASLEHHRLASKLDPNVARGQVHMFDCPSRMGGEWSSYRMRRNHIAYEADFAPG